MQVAGKVFRIGHLGNSDEVMMLSAISGAEMALIDAGYTGFTPGSGVGEAIKYWQVGFEFAECSDVILTHIRAQRLQHGTSVALRRAATCHD